MLKHELEYFWPPFVEEVELVIMDSNGTLVPIDKPEYHMEKDGTGKIALLLPKGAKIVFEEKREAQQKKEKLHFDVWVDGACSGNPGPGGWAYVIKTSTGEHYRDHGTISDKVTNNQMELMAPLKAIEMCATICKSHNIMHNEASIHIFSDSEYVVDLMIGRKKARTNHALVNALQNAGRVFSVKWGWVGRNSSEPLIYCDEHAKKAAKAVVERGAN